MNQSLKLISAAVLAVAIPTGANAFQVGTPDTYADLLWRVSSSVPGLTGCNELQVDATGDLRVSTKLSIYGALNCPFQQGGSYGVTGSGYFSADGTFTMTLTVGASTSLQCVRMSGGLNGTCTYYDTSGSILGSAFLTFR